MDVVNSTPGTYSGRATQLSPHLFWSSSCTDFLKMLTNSAIIWTGPREGLDTVVVLFTLLCCLL